MDPAQAARMMAALGIQGIDPSKMSLIMSLVQELGTEVQVDPEELQAYYPQVEDSFYMPRNVPKNFYYDAQGLRKAGKIGDMRDLTSVNANVFRRLLGLQ